MPTPEIMARLRDFRERYRNKQVFYERLVTEGQHPKVLFFACSDSRVSPELLLNAQLGDLFVLRSVANIIPPFGTGEMGIGAAIEYAVLHLRVEHIVVWGHTDCAGLKALDTPPDWSREPHVARWAEHARPAKSKVEASGLPEEERPLATARENVLLQLEHLRSYDPVRDSEKAGTLTLHGWLYRLESGTFEGYDPQARRWTAIGATA